MYDGLKRGKKMVFTMTSDHHFYILTPILTLETAIFFNHNRYPDKTSHDPIYRPKSVMSTIGPHTLYSKISNDEL